MYAAELVTGALQSLTPCLVLLICHKILVRLLNHFIQQFFWGGGSTTSGNTFRLFVDFSGQFQRDGTISTFITPFLLLPGTFQFIHNIAALLAFLPILKMRTKHPYMMYRLNCQGLVSENLRLACSFRNVPVMKNRKFSLCCKMYPLILRFRFLCVFNSLYLLSF